MLLSFIFDSFHENRTRIKYFNNCSLTFKCKAAKEAIVLEKRVN